MVTVGYLTARSEARMAGNPQQVWHGQQTIADQTSRHSRTDPIGSRPNLSISPTEPPPRCQTGLSHPSPRPVGKGTRRPAGRLGNLRELVTAAAYRHDRDGAGPLC